MSSTLCHNFSSSSSNESHSDSSTESSGASSPSPSLENSSSVSNPRREALRNLCNEYTRNHDVQLPIADYEPLEVELPIPRRSNRTPSVMLNGNTRHLCHFRHRDTGTKILFCYFSRFVRVKRFQGQLNKIMLALGYRNVKLHRKADRVNPVLAPFMQYVPDFLKASNPRASKNNMETFAGFFKLYVKEPQSLKPALEDFQNCYELQPSWSNSIAPLTSTSQALPVQDKLQPFPALFQPQLFNPSFVQHVSGEISSEWVTDQPAVPISQFFSGSQLPNYPYQDLSQSQPFPRILAPQMFWPDNRAPEFA